VAEFWLGEDRLWFTLFWDDKDGQLKIELLPSLRGSMGYLVDFAETERLIETAKREILAMASASE